MVCRSVIVVFRVKTVEGASVVVLVKRPRFLLVEDFKVE